MLYNIADRAIIDLDKVLSITIEPGCLLIVKFINHDDHVCVHFNSENEIIDAYKAIVEIIGNKHVVQLSYVKTRNEFYADYNAKREPKKRFI